MADRQQDAPSWATAPAAALAVGLLLALMTTVTYVAGGTRTVLPHLFYVPIMLAALRFGLGGGVAAALAATLLCGPLMPLDVAAGEPQQLANWASRGAFFLIVGSLAGEMLRVRRRTYERGLNAEFEREIRLGTVPLTMHDPTAETRVRKVLGERSFHPVFQPIYCLDDGHLLSIEALTRFTTEPLRPPDVWFTEAARVGLGRELELAAIELALERSGDIPDDVALSVNSSPATLTDPRFRQLVLRHRNRSLIVEVTEHAVVDDYARLALAVDDLRSLGVALAVDDVGAGISSLRHIVRLAPDIIKLDTSLTQHLHDDPVRRVLADCLIQFARRTERVLVAEGIEEASDLATWRGLGASAAQGYLLGRPGPLPAPLHNELIGPPHARYPSSVVRHTA